MNNEALFNKLCGICRNSVAIPEENMDQVENLTRIKEIYHDWESNDFGDSFYLYEGLEPHRVSKSYFLLRHSRDWSGGWSSEDYYYWFKISEGTFLMLCSY